MHGAWGLRHRHCGPGSTNVPGARATLTLVKRIVRFALLVPGLLYLWALMPVSLRPQYSGSPFRKPDPTITVDVSAWKLPGGAAPAALIAQTAVPQPANSRLKAACEPPRLLRPIIRPSQHVDVRYVDNGRVVAERVYDCKSLPKA